jgi:hypothetical protein
MVGAMPRPSPKALLMTAANYLKEHPEEILRTVKDAFALRVGIPLDALRYLAAEFGQGKKAPKDVVLEAAPPGLRIAMTVAAMGSTLRVKLTIFIEQLELGNGAARVTTRIADMALEVLDGGDTPLAGLIKSGALDLSKPGNLVAFMPKRPEMLVDAKDDRVVLDLMKVPKLAENKKFRRTLEVVTPVLTVAGIDTEADHLYLQLRASPSGLSEAIARAQSAA